MKEPAPKRTWVLDPIDRVSEIVFGVLMALSITGSHSVATASGEEIETMLTTALGCNLAWGFTDAVMYLVQVAIERRRRITLLRRLQATGDPREAHRLIAGTLPVRLVGAADADTLEALRRRLAAVSLPGTGLGVDDYRAAVRVFVLVVLATFPVVIPFIVFDHTAIAMRVSNLLALATLFAGGYALGRHAGGTPWLYGLVLSAIGVALISVIIALGG